MGPMWLKSKMNKKVHSRNAPALLIVLVSCFRLPDFPQDPVCVGRNLSWLLRNKCTTTGRQYSLNTRMILKYSWVLGSQKNWVVEVNILLHLVPHSIGLPFKGVHLAGPAIESRSKDCPWVFKGLFDIIPILLELTYDHPSARVFHLVHERSSWVPWARILIIAIFLLCQSSEHLVVLELVRWHSQVDPLQLWALQMCPLFFFYLSREPVAISLSW